MQGEGPHFRRVGACPHRWSCPWQDHIVHKGRKYPARPFGPRRRRHAFALQLVTPTGPLLSDTWIKLQKVAGTPKKFHRSRGPVCGDVEIFPYLIPLAGPEGSLRFIWSRDQLELFRDPINPPIDPWAVFFRSSGPLLPWRHFPGPDRVGHPHKKPVFLLIRQLTDKCIPDMI